MSTNKTILMIIIIFIGTGLIVKFNTGEASTSAKSNPGSSAAVSVKFVSSTITADGSVTAQNQAKLNFQTPGKLIKLPFKEGDVISAGQTIAQLDTTALRQQLQLAANTYEMTKNTAAQTLENQKAGIIEGQQRISLDTYNKNGYSAIPETTVVYDAVKRLVDNTLLSQNSAQLSVGLANYALQLSTLTSPLQGIITHEDVAVAGINITPSTTFKVADPDTMVFRANIPAEQVYYISEGSAVSLAIDGLKNKINGTVIKIYPSKVTLPNGQSVYQIDIAGDELKQQSRLDQTGMAIISTNSQNVALVPAYTVLAGKYIWIDNNGNPQLKQVTAGKIHGNEIEIISGLSPADKIIIDPKYIKSQKYHLL